MIYHTTTKSEDNDFFYKKKKKIVIKYPYYPIFLSLKLVVHELS